MNESTSRIITEKMTGKLIGEYTDKYKKYIYTQRRN